MAGDLQDADMADVSFTSSHEQQQHSNYGISSPARGSNGDNGMPMTSLNRRRPSEVGEGGGGGGGGGGSFYRSTQFHEKPNRNVSQTTPFNGSTDEYNHNNNFPQPTSSNKSCSTHNSEKNTTTTSQSRPLPDQSAFDRSIGGVGGLNSSFTSCPATPGRSTSFCPATPLRTTPSWGMAHSSSGSGAVLSERSSHASQKGPSLDISDDQLMNTSSGYSSSSSTGYRSVIGRDDNGVDGNGNNVHNTGGSSSTKSQDLNHSLWWSRQQSLTANKGMLIGLSFFSSISNALHYNPILIHNL